MEASTPAQSAFLAWVEALRRALNEACAEADGGALLGFAGKEKALPSARILPVGGDFVFLLSEQIPHAVEETRAPRLAIAAWWRINQSDTAQVDPSD